VAESAGTRRRRDVRFDRLIAGVAGGRWLLRLLSSVIVRLAAIVTEVGRRDAADLRSIPVPECHLDLNSSVGVAEFHDGRREFVARAPERTGATSMKMG